MRGARIERVEVTDEAITAYLVDGRVISVPLFVHDPFGNRIEVREPGGLRI